MAEFYTHGYHATAMSDLLRVTKLHKGSLYGAFGDKHQLFLTILQRYAQQRTTAAATDLRAPKPPILGIGHYLQRISRNAAGQRGCLLANTALELLPGNEEVAQIVDHTQREIQRELAGALDRARIQGLLSVPQNNTVVARYLFTVVEGLWELGRTTADERPLLEVVEMTMYGLR
ncbi:TetR/AcrR family transcriptional regulator [Fodinicola feengrottensis]|uniref:TetR/AcrR family transcriptional regulator n=2 Tax=Fodinicola feengrottensis TaxID=435914 RepID=A0ABN2IC50_9ACTN